MPWDETNEFWYTFYYTFSNLFRVWFETELDFPEPIGTITPFNITAFFVVAELLATLVNIVSSRGDNA